jgi:hypothetical protein
MDFSLAESNGIKMNSKKKNKKCTTHGQVAQINKEV